jgi:hypothetical protein
LLSRKVKYLSHLAKHEGRSIAIVVAMVGAKQRRISGDDRCWSMLAAPQLREDGGGRVCRVYRCGGVGVVQLSLQRRAGAEKR